MSKTAFEIRTDLLALAYNILSAQHMANEAARANSGRYSASISLSPTTSPTIEDVITEARKLNEFVSQPHT